MKREPSDAERKQAEALRKPMAKAHAMGALESVVPGETWSTSFTPTLKSLNELRKWIEPAKQDAVTKEPQGQTAFELAAGRPLVFTGCNNPFAEDLESKARLFDEQVLAVCQYEGRILGGVAVVHHLPFDFWGVKPGPLSDDDGIEGLCYAPGDGWILCSVFHHLLRGNHRSTSPVGVRAARPGQDDSPLDRFDAATFGAAKAGQILHSACAHQVYHSIAARFVEALAGRGNHRVGNDMRTACSGGGETGRVRHAVGIRWTEHTSYPTLESQE
eukprot:3742142-Rhodomonas_salina.2